VDTHAKKRSLKAIAVMLNSFPAQNGTDVELLMASFLECVDDFSPEAVEMACLRYRKGEVKDHDGRFAPTTAMFTRQVRARQEYLDLRQRAGPALPPPERPRDDSPLVSKEKMQALSDCWHGRRSWKSLADEYGVDGEDKK
jgi:hypothetical protein